VLFLGRSIVPFSRGGIKRENGRSGKVVFYDPPQFLQRIRRDTGLQLLLGILRQLRNIVGEYPVRLRVVTLPKSDLAVVDTQKINRQQGGAKQCG
jgi:hypothetical protein